MHTLRTKFPVKRGNVAMVMVICIVVVYTMLACCTYSVIVSQDQISVSHDTVEFANIDATVNAAAIVVEHSIKTEIQKMKPSNDLENDLSWFVPENFVDAYADQIRQLVRDIAVTDIKSTSFTYVKRVPQYVHEENTYYYDCLVLSIEADNRIYNLAFYVNDSDESSGDGLERQKGTYLFTWNS